VNRAAIFVSVLALFQTVAAGVIFGWSSWGTWAILATEIVVIPLARWFLTWFFLRALRRRG
jgi:hypothetical protein